MTSRMASSVSDRRIIYTGSKYYGTTPLTLFLSIGVMTSPDSTVSFTLQDLQVLQGLVDQIESTTLIQWLYFF